MKAARRDEARWDDRETDWLSRVAPLSEQPDRTAYRDEINALRRKSDKLPDTPERRMARRLLTGEFIRHIESGRQFLTEKRYPEAALRFGLAGEVRPGDPGAAYALARALALAGDRKAALKALSKAAAKGFRDATRLKQDPCYGVITRGSRVPVLTRKNVSKVTSPNPWLTLWKMVYSLANKHGFLSLHRRGAACL